MLAKVFPIQLKPGNQAATEELIAGRFAHLIVEFVEHDHELLVSL